MTHSKIMELLDETGIPYAYDHFKEGESPDPPFITFRYPGSNNFGADGIVWRKIQELNIELYTNSKRPDIEEQLEAVLDENELFYDKSETWIDSEKLYEVLYELEVVFNAE